MRKSQTRRFEERQKIMDSNLDICFDTEDTMDVVITTTSGDLLLKGNYFNSVETARNENIMWNKNNPSLMVRKADLKNNTGTTITQIKIKAVDGLNSRTFKLKHIEDQDDGVVHLILAGIKENV